MPDYSNWLHSSQNSVVEFAIRMIAKFNQFENISELLPLLDHPSEEVRREAIRSLSALEHQEIIDLIKHLGSYNDLLMLKDKMQDNEWDLKIKYYSIAQDFLPEKKQSIYTQYEKEKALLL